MDNACVHMFVCKTHAYINTLGKNSELLEGRVEGDSQSVKYGDT
jgi:hypothetical protein